MATHKHRVMFPDLDGILHQRDMFGSFLRCLLHRQPLNVLLVLSLLPIIAITLLIKDCITRWSISLPLWGCIFGHSEARLQTLQAGFVRWSHDDVTTLSLVQGRLTTYLLSPNAGIWLTTGSPQPPAEAAYFDTS